MEDMTLLIELSQNHDERCKESKEAVRNRLENDLAEPSNLDKEIYDDLDFFLSMGSSDVDLNFIISSICVNGFLTDFCIYRRQDAFIPYASRFYSLILYLQERYKDLLI